MDRKYKIHNTYIGKLIVSKYGNPILETKQDNKKTYTNIINGIAEKYLDQNVTLVLTVKDDNGDDKDIYNYCGRLVLRGGNGQFKTDIKIGSQRGFCEILEDYVDKEIEISILVNNELESEFVVYNKDNFKEDNLEHINYKNKTYKEVNLNKLTLIEDRET